MKTFLSRLNKVDANFTGKTPATTPVKPPAKASRPKSVDNPDDGAMCHARNWEK